MKKKLSEGRESKRQALLRKKKEEPAAFWTYVVLRFIVILILIRCILRGDIESAFVCVVVLVIYLLPQFVENRLNIGLYDTMEDLFVNFVGAVVFSVAAFFECKSEKRPLTTALTLRRKKKPQNT